MAANHHAAITNGFTTKTTTTATATATAIATATATVTTTTTGTTILSPLDFVWDYLGEPVPER